MVILHIAAIDNNVMSGVNAVVPKHVAYQGKYVKTALINTKNVKITNVKNQFYYKKDLFESIPAPYNRPDLVVFHECYNGVYLFIYRYLLKKGIPYIIIPHGELRKEALQKKKVKKCLANILFFDRFINNSLALQLLSAQEDINTLLGKKHIVATNGVELPSNYKSDYSFNDRDLNIVYIGRMDPVVKGIDLLIEAIENVKMYLTKNRVKLYMYGPDLFNRHNIIKKMIKDHMVDDIVDLKREVTEKEKERVLLHSDIFIQTSRHEGMPMGILEALSYGVPCLVTKGTSLGHIIKENCCGWVADTNSDSIAAALVKAVAEKDMIGEYGNRARQTIENEFQWGIIAKDTLQKYKELLGLKKNEE